MYTDRTPRLRGRKAVAQRLRRLKRTSGLCEMCRARGIVRLATVVDHIIPLERGGPDIDSNTRNLCDDHNRQVTAEQFGYRRRPVEIGLDGWPVDDSGGGGQKK
jgi:5-methylcytosine-specific restriction protein A